MSRVYSDTVLPEDSGVNQDLTLGTTGDTVQVTAGASLNVNTLKDSGGNTLFTSDGSGNLSSMNSAFSGGPTLIATNTLTGSSTYSDFTISGSYKLYIFSIQRLWCATDGSPTGINFSDDGSNFDVTKTTTIVEAYHSESNTQAGLQYVASQDQKNTGNRQNLFFSTSNEADSNASATVHLFNPHSTTYYKQFYSVSSMFGDLIGERNIWVGGWLSTTAAIQKVRFDSNAGNLTGVIKMYGL